MASRTSYKSACLAKFYLPAKIPKNWIARHDFTSVFPDMKPIMDAKTPAAKVMDEKNIESASEMERRSRKIGILLMMAAYLSFTVLDSSAKWLGRSLPPLEIAWARYVGASILALAMIRMSSAPSAFVSGNLKLQIMRSFALFISTVLNFIALLYLQLAQTVSIFFGLPLLVALLAGPMLGEWVGPRRLIAIGFGFIGILVVTGPGIGGFQPAMILSLIGTLCNAFYNIWTRRLATIDSWQTTLNYSSLLGTVLLTLTLPTYWVWPQTALQWSVMLIPGVAGVVGHYFLILAHRRAPASILAPFIYTQIAWMVTAGFLLFGDVPSISTLAGGAVVIASGLYLWYRERAVHAEISADTL